MLTECHLVIIIVIISDMLMSSYLSRETSDASCPERSRPDAASRVPLPPSGGSLSGSQVNVYGLLTVDFAFTIVQLIHVAGPLLEM